MKDIGSRLTILLENNGTFTDFSDDLCDLGTDNVTMTLLASNTLYLGFPKPIPSCFFYATTPSLTTRTLSVNCYTDAGWVAMPLLDDTKGLTRTGHIQWSLPETLTTANTVNGVLQCWIRLQVSLSTSAMIVRGISALFSDDRDLAREFSKINDAGFRLGAPDHILIHEAARDEIVQMLRNRGLRTVRNGYYKRLTFWDLLDIQEVRLAATYLALSKIFENVANASENDNWRVKSKMYYGKFEKAFELAFLAYDRLQDGNVSTQRDMTVGVLNR